jgi:hypothetical protein
LTFLLDRDIFELKNTSPESGRCPSLLIKASEFRAEGMTNFASKFKDKQIQISFDNSHLLKLDAMIKYNFLLNFKDFIANLFKSETEDPTNKRSARASYGGNRSIINEVVWDLDLRFEEVEANLEVKHASKKNLVKNESEFIQWKIFGFQLKRKNKKNHLKYV